MKENESGYAVEIYIEDDAEGMTVEGMEFPEREGLEDFTI